MATIRTEDVKKTFSLGKVDVEVLKGISLDIESGEFVSLMGASGSGKSTLLNLIGGLMPPTEGRIYVNDTLISNMSENALCLFRKKHVGFIFQSYNLMPGLTAVENVELPLVFQGLSKHNRRKRAEEMLERIGLSDRLHHRPFELSGGQQQRVSIARALINNPEVVLADEPTGNLDSKSGTSIMELLTELNKTNKQTFIIVTHDPSVSAYTDRVVHLKDGQIVLGG